MELKATLQLIGANYFSLFATHEDFPGLKPNVTYGFRAKQPFVATAIETGVYDGRPLGLDAAALLG